MNKYLGLFFVFAFLVEVPLASAGFVPQPSTLSLSKFIIKSADTHLGRQGVYLNGTTGQNNSNVWEWEIGSGQTFSNIQGITAEGMLGAYDRTSNPDYLTAAIGTADVLKNRYDNNAPSRPFAQDVAFFVHLCRSSGDTSWCTYATNLYARVINDFPTGAANTDRYINARRSLAGWDVSWHIRAAQLTGYNTYAQDMANRLFAERGAWEGVLLGGFDYTVLSHNTMHWAYGKLPGQGANTATLKSFVLGSQDTDGSWGGDFQATAYALIGLDALSTTERQAVNAAVAFFMNTANSEGGWQYDGEPEYGEINSEVISALAGVPSLLIRFTPSSSTSSFSGMNGPVQ